MGDLNSYQRPVLALCVAVREALLYLYIFRKTEDVFDEITDAQESSTAHLRYGKHGVLIRRI